MASQTRVHWFRCLRLGCLLLAIALTQFVPFDASAQSAIDAKTPPGQAPGAPTGSYPLSGFENVNLFNGHLNFRLPLLQVNGRGGVGFVSAVSIEQRWTVDHDSSGYHFPNYNWWTGLRPGYGPGVLQGRQMSEGCSEGYSLTQGTTRLTFTSSDGTEYELRDQIYGGQVASSNCDPYNPQAPGTSRGTVFVTADGNSATFISDTTIFDHTYTPSGPKIITPSGYLMLRDGTRYRIYNGMVTWIRDRNGNKISFTYQGSYLDQRITSATDSLNRQITYQYNYPDPTYGVCDRIILKGFGGAERIIRIVRTSLSNALISGESPATYYSLFPTLNGSSFTYHNPDVISIVWLPDGVRSYQFHYNHYGELCRVDLPTGGRFEYSWTQFSQGMGSQPEINRRVTERRTYTETGTLASRSTYGSYESDGFGAQGTVQADHLDFDGALLSREKHYFHGHPFSYTVAGQFDLSNPIEGREFKTEFFNTNGTTVLRRLENTWTTCATLVGTAINPCISQTIITLEPATTNLVSKETFSYDSYNNQTNVYEYSFGTGSAGALMRRTQTDYLTTNPVNGTNYATTASIHLRSLTKEVQVFDGGGVKRARTTLEYDNYTTDANHAGLVNRASITGFDSSFTTSYGTRGNATANTRYILDTSGQVTSSTSTYQQYDIAGNLVKVIDGRSYVTVFDFADRFGTPDGNAQANSGAAELGGQASYAFASKVTNALGHTTYSQFDYYLGRPVDAEDTNGVVSSFVYDDSFDRLTQIRRAVSTSASNQTTFGYEDSDRRITTSSDRDNFGDNLLVSQSLYDGLGRTKETRQYEGESNYIVTETKYDALNRGYKTSNPYRPWQGQSAVWTTTVFDALGRVTSVTTPDNAAVTTSYAGNSVTVTDPAGKARKSVTDALGRLIEVYEDPGGVNYQTTYSYDVLDNLVKVTQGSQQRFFMYDSLKRLIRTHIPEQDTLASLNLFDPITNHSTWSTAYEYDNNGNLRFKTDARGVVTETRYDALNRVTTILYRINGQPDPNTSDVDLLYDNATYGKGRLWGTYKWGTKPSHTAVGLYDALGRVKQFDNLFGDGQGGWSAEYKTNRTYDRAGNVTSQTYPSGHNVSYSYDSANRASSFTGNLGDGTPRTYASSIQYSPFGGITKEQFGTQQPLYHHQAYNIRGQVYYIAMGPNNDDWGGDYGKLIYYYGDPYCFGCSGSENNGNVRLIDYYLPGGHLIHDHYAYDSLNRLLDHMEEDTAQQFRQYYSYDRYGNRTIDQTLSWGGINETGFTVNAANNRLGVPVGQSGSMDYDAVGNLTNDTYTGAGFRTYDAENRIVSAWGNGQAQFYTYNADGQRVRRQVNGVETWEIYGIDGELLAEYAVNASPSSPQKEFGYRNGQLLVTAEPSASGAQNVTWTNAVGVTVTSNSLTRDSAPVGWTAGASSAQAIASGDGYVEFSAAETNTNRMCGLSNGDTNQDYSDIDFALYLYSDGTFYVFESGVNKGNFGSYASGDRFRVSVEGGVVKYRRNGTLVFSSTVTPTYPLLVDTALSIPNATISNVTLSANGVENVQWTTAVNVTVTGNSLTKPTSGNVAWDAGAVSTQVIASGDGYAEFTAAETNTNRMAGLSNGNSGQDYSDIDFAIYLYSDGHAYIFEGGVSKGDVGSYASGDTFRVAVESGVVKYRKNGTLLYTSAATPTYPLLVDTAISVPGGTLNNVKLSGTLVGSAAANINWLVTDHLGTPRMIFDQSGSLSNVKRHDYLPFGEDLSAGTGGRTPQQGYVGGDGVRQQFTQYERDIETGLDFAEARYYSSIQGRFTRPDPYNILFEMKAGRNAREQAQMLRWYSSEPQNWNRYSYCLNDPVNLIDPSGLVWLTKDHENYQWVDDDKYKEEDWKGYEKAEAGTIAYFGEGWGGYQDKYKGLMGSYVTLNADGSLSAAGVAPSDEPTSSPANPEYTNYTEGIGNFGVGMIVQDSRIHPTFSYAPSWPNFSLSKTTGQGLVQPGVYGQGTVGNYGLVVNESINLLHPTSGFSREVGIGTPQASAGIQVIFPALNGMTQRDWLHHPDNPLGKGPEGRGGGRCPY